MNSPYWATTLSGQQVSIATFKGWALNQSESVASEGTSQPPGPAERLKWLDKNRCSWSAELDCTYLTIEVYKLAYLSSPEDAS